MGMVPKYPRIFWEPVPIYPGSEIFYDRPCPPKAKTLPIRTSRRFVRIQASSDFTMAKTNAAGRLSTVNPRHWSRRVTMTKAALSNRGSSSKPALSPPPPHPSHLHSLTPPPPSPFSRSGDGLKINQPPKRLNKPFVAGRKPRSSRR